MSNPPFTKGVAPGPSSGLIEVLSWRTYTSLVSSLREVVSNASDADADNLNMTLSVTYDEELGRKVYKLTFFDDGEGMTVEMFENYLRLAGKGRRQRTGAESTTSGRPIIGMLGIGSLAIAPWAQRVEILTKRRGSTQVLHIKIPYAKFFNNPSIRDTELYGQGGEYEYEKRTFKAAGLEASEVDKGFTIIDLVGLNEEATNELFDASEWQQNHSDPSDLGLLDERGYQDYEAYSTRGQRKTFRQFSPLLRFMHRLALLIPVPYPANTPLGAPPIRAMMGRLDGECMRAITFQGVKLQRPMIVLDRHLGASMGQRKDKSLTHQGKHIYIHEQLPESKVQIRGYIWGQNTQIRFEELTGVQVRVKNVGIGPYNFALFDPVQEGERPRGNRAARTQSISGEIFIDYSPELERALRGDREGFQENSRVYRELRSAVYKRITNVYTLIDRFEPRRNEVSNQDTVVGDDIQLAPPTPNPTQLAFGPATSDTNETPAALVGDHQHGPSYLTPRTLDLMPHKRIRAAHPTRPPLYLPELPRARPRGIQARAPRPVRSMAQQTADSLDAGLTKVRASVRADIASASTSGFKFSLSPASPT